VLATDCTPIPGAWLDFWQADGNGQYDNTGYRLRGHQFTDDDGHYYLETVFPGLYPGRPRHIHVKVQAPNQPALTTQLYFPGEASNQSDSFFFPQLLVTMQETDEGVMATFNFILEIQ
jgi:protocatechuate 3,4-dioxygenase beta subunit